MKYRSTLFLPTVDIVDQKFCSLFYYKLSIVYVMLQTEIRQINFQTKSSCERLFMKILEHVVHPILELYENMHARSIRFSRYPSTPFREKPSV